MKAGDSFFRRIAAQFAFAPIAIADFDLRTGQAHRFPLPTIHQAIAFSPPRFSDISVAPEPGLKKCCASVELSNGIPDTQNRQFDVR